MCIRDRSEADPILPLDPPASWDREVDLVVVGTGGGGLAATTLAAESGSSVIAVEKEGTVGGATRHALGYVIFAGGSKLQNELGAAWPGPEFDPVASVNELGPYYQYSLNVPMYANVLVAGAECIDWMLSLIHISNICVISNAVLAKAACPEVPVIVDAACTASFDDSLNEKALDVLEGLQVQVTNRVSAA